MEREEKKERRMKRKKKEKKKKKTKKTKTKTKTTTTPLHSTTKERNQETITRITHKYEHYRNGSEHR